MDKGFFERAQMFTRDLTAEEEAKVLDKEIPPIRRFVDSTPPMPQQEYEDLKARVLATRQVIEDYRQKHQRAHQDGSWSDKLSEQLIASLNKGYLDNGFENEEDFYAENKRLCFEEIQRCFQVFGTCDGCLERTLGCCLNMPTSSKYEPSLISATTYRYFPRWSSPNCKVYTKQISETSFDIYWGTSAMDLAGYGKMLKQRHPDNYKKLKVQFKGTEYADMFPE